MRRLYAAVLAGALALAAGCSADEEPTAPKPSPSETAPAASMRTAWQASAVRVRPDRVGRDAPWVWKYSDDIVVIEPRGLVALDRETGSEVWRLPLGGRVCGATPSPSEVGLVAVTVGRCEARRTTLKAVDLESASVVWERPVDGAPQLDIGGEVLLVADGCATRRIELSSGRPISGLGIACDDLVLAGDGVVVISDADAPREWRVVDVESGSTVAEVTGPMPLSAPLRIVTGDPLTMLSGSPLASHTDLDLVRVSDSTLRILGAVPSVATTAFAHARGDSVVLADDGWPGASELSLEDGSTLGGFPGVGAARWIPFAVYADGVLGFDGTSNGLDSGHGRLTLRSLDDGAVTELGELGGETFLGETNLAVAAPKAVVIDDILLMPGRGNDRVLAYRLHVDPAGG